MGGRRRRWRDRARRVRGKCSPLRRAVIQLKPSFRVISGVEFAVVFCQLWGISGISGTHPSTFGHAKAAAEKPRKAPLWYWSSSRRAGIRLKPSFRIILWVEFAVVIRHLLGIPWISGTHPSTSGRAKAAAEKQRQVRSGVKFSLAKSRHFIQTFVFC